MSSRVLRKGRSRAAARDVNYDEGAPEESEEEIALRPRRKRPTRTSARLADPILSRESPEDEDPPPPAKSESPDAMEVDQEEAPGPSNSTSPSRTPSEGANASDVVKPSARKVRLRLSKATKLPPTPAEDDDEEEDEIDEEKEEENDDDNDNDGDEQDESEVGFESEEEGDEPSASTSAAPSARPSVPLTARQAALAGLGTAEVPLLSLDALEANRKKGPLKTEEELAVKRREAAKRRKLQLEQKTKEEKEGAVDRLLNKQAPRPRAKRNMSGIPTTTGTPTGYLTPTRQPVRTADVGDTDTRSTSPDGDGSASAEGSTQSIPMATTIRWVSTSRGTDAGRPLIEEIPSAETKEPESTMEVEASPSDASPPATAPDTEKAPANGVVVNGISPKRTPEAAKSFSFALSIPPNLLAQFIPPANPSTPDPPSPPRDALTHCGVVGCAQARKYRVVLPTGEQKGACGLEHFRVLKGVVAGN